MNINQKHVNKRPRPSVDWVVGEVSSSLTLMKKIVNVMKTIPHTMLLDGS